jgi:hypothetical protein
MSYFGNIQTGGVESLLNKSTTSLNSGETFTGTAEKNTYTDVMVSCKTDQSGTLYFDMSVDGTNFETFPSTGFMVTAGIHELHNAVKGSRYFRVRFTNTSGSDQTYFRLYTYYGQFKQLNAPLMNGLSNDSDATTVRSVLAGQTDGGIFKYIPVDSQGHLEVALHHPRLPFGSIHTEKLYPVFQVDGVYGLNSGQALWSSSLSGSASSSDSMLFVSTGTTIYSQAQIQSRKRLRYRPGQGIVGRFAGKFTAGVTQSYQVIGYGHAEDGVFFGYKNEDFGILYSNRGRREVRRFTITTPSSNAESVSIILNGTTYSISVTNSSNIQRTVWEISQGVYTGWSAYPGSTNSVIFVNDSAGVKSNTFNYVATSMVGTFSRTLAGQNTTELFIPQSEWNGDKLDGTGGSGFTIDPTKGNVFQIGIQYLGFGTINFDVETTSSGNNANFISAHTLKLPNTLSTTSFGNPSFPFTMAVYSAGSTTGLTVSVGSFAGFIEGDKVLQGNRFSYFNSLGGVVTAGAYHTLFTILNKRFHNGRTSQIVVNIKDIVGEVKHTQPVRFYLIKNGSLLGNPSFTEYSSISGTSWDTSATSVTFTDNSQLIWSGGVGETGQLDSQFVDEITLQPGEWLSVAARSVQNTAAWVSAGLNTREDQ